MVTFVLVKKKTYMPKVITFGEIMLRLSTPNHERFIQADEFDVNYGGGEANVAVSLANYGYDVDFVTAVPDNDIGECAVAALRKYNVGTKYIARCGERLGIYYLESGSAMRPSKVIYDRAHSSISTATEADFDLDAIFSDADWFHFTGITPAISDAAAALTEKALICAKAHGVTVSCDLNFRKKLWSEEKAQKVMTGFMKYVDVIIGNEEDAEKVLGFKPGNTDVTSGELEMAGYKDIFNQMCDKFGFKYVISSLRESFSASHNGWSACIMDGATRDFYRSNRFDIMPIVDRVGGGDSFAGGLICGLMDGKSKEDALNFAVAASALKHTIPGDFNLVSRSDVDNLVGGDGSGRVQR
jgi:2-dehydro-3-deoxygluconokinase